MPSSAALPTQSGVARGASAERSAAVKGASGSASSACSQAAKPGTGESVTRVFRFGSSWQRSAATCLMRKLPKEMPRSPFWQFEIE